MMMKKNVVLAVLVLVILILILYKTSSLASPMNPPTPAASSPSVVGPRNGQKWYFIKSGESCPDGYSSTPSPTICKLNNS